MRVRATGVFWGVPLSEGWPGERGCCRGLLVVLLLVGFVGLMFLMPGATAVGVWGRLGVWGLEVRPADGVRDEGVLGVRGAVVGRGGVALGVDAVLIGLGF